MKLLDVVLKHFVGIVIGVLILVVAGLGWSLFQEQNRNENLRIELIGKTSAYRQLSDSFARLATEYATQDRLLEAARESFAKELRENEDLRRQLRAVGSTTFTVINEPETRSDTVPGAAGFYQEVGFNQGPPVGYVKMNESGLVTHKLLNFDIEVKQIVTQDETSGKTSVYAKGFYVLREQPADSRWVGVPFPLKISDGTLVIDPTKSVIPKEPPKTFKLAPHLNAGVFGGMTALGPGFGAHADISVFGWGRTKNDLDYKILGVGVNGNRNYLDLNLVPISMRIPGIPLLTDIYVAPGVGFGTEGTSYFLALEGTL